MRSDDDREEEGRRTDLRNLAKLDQLEASMSRWFEVLIEEREALHRLVDKIVSCDDRDYFNADEMRLIAASIQVAMLAVLQRERGLARN